MRLANSLRKGVMETSVGSIVNGFMIRERRRYVLFFNQIFTEYIRQCEKAGYGSVLERISHDSTVLYFTGLVPGIVKKFPKYILFNTILRHIWINVGLLDDLRYAKKGNVITIQTKGEAFTRDIGKNRFMVGQYAGILEGGFGCKVKCIDAKQTKESCDYRYVLDENSTMRKVECKSLTEYVRLNRNKKKSEYTLEDALRKNIFQLKENNKIYFKGRSILNGENTVMHLLGSRGPILDEMVPKISKEFFMETLGKPESKRGGLHLLKNLLQIMGWGKIDILTDDESVRIQIMDPPHGLQAAKDNWDFLANTILGYLWVIDDEYMIKSKTYDPAKDVLMLVYFTGVETRENG